MGGWEGDKESGRVEGKGGRGERMGGSKVG